MTDSIGWGPSTHHVQKLDSSGNLVWDDSFGAAAAVTALAVDPSSKRVVMAGQNGGTVDFGTGPLTGTTQGDTFVVEFAP